MVEIFGMGAEAETLEVYDEGRSVLGSLVTRLIAIVHRVIDEVLKLARQLLRYAGEHPLALVLTVANLCIWMS
jgi:hypothetical protein